MMSVPKGFDDCVVLLCPRLHRSYRFRLVEDVMFAYSTIPAVATKYQAGPGVVGKGC